MLYKRMTEQQHMYVGCRYKRVQECLHRLKFTWLHTYLQHLVLLRSRVCVPYAFTSYTDPANLVLSRQEMPRSTWRRWRPGLKRTLSTWRTLGTHKAISSVDALECIYIACGTVARTLALRGSDCFRKKKHSTFAATSGNLLLGCHWRGSLAARV